ncbi:MAG: hypothetical protein MUE30_10985 [Spirosomaceae bacterium]|jgi:hypothetical protein|nr:hypothetical protein [Spirosomataceae bacterium]
MTLDTKIDVAISFYGKPYQTIVTIETLLKHSGQHIDKIFLTRELFQPHHDDIGIFKIIDYFRKRPEVKLEVYFPAYFLGLGVMMDNFERAKTDARFRHSILFQYAFEKTDKKYLCPIHNDMVFFGDMIGQMLNIFEHGRPDLLGVGMIGQCWNCPAGPNYAQLCNGDKYQDFVPSKEELLALLAKYDSPRKDYELKVIETGRVHPLPECRLNEYCAMVDVEKYRQETLPNGPVGCFGGNWGGTDIVTIWTHDMFNRGYTFKNLSFHSYAHHGFFDPSGSGNQANSSRDLYFMAEANAQKYISEHWGEIKFSIYVPISFFLYKLKRKIAGWFQR